MEGNLAPGTRTPLKLGKLPPAPSKSGPIGDYGPIPAAPSTYFGGLVYPPNYYPMDGNDVYGDCVMAGADHMLGRFNQLSPTTDNTPRPTLAEIEAEYFKLTGGPDSGLVIQSVLEVWATQGLWSTTIAAFAPVVLGNRAQLSQAIYYYGAVKIGIQCPESAQTAYWDLGAWHYVPGSPIVGGHEIVAIAYDLEYVYCCSWGTVVAVTYNFLNHYADEMWALIPPQFVNAGGSPRLNIAALRADLGLL